MIANFRIRTKLIALVVITMLSTLVVGLVFVGTIHTMQTNLRQIQEQRLTQILAIHEAQASLERMRQEVYKYAILGSEAHETISKVINNEQQAIDMALARYVESSDDEQESEAIDVLKAYLKVYYQERDQVQMLIDRGDNIFALKRINEQLAEKEKTVVTLLQERAEFTKQAVAEVVAQSEASTARVGTTVLIALAAFMLVAGVFSWLVQKDIVSRLRRLQVMAERLAVGDLTIDDQPVGSDEIHHVTVALNTAIENIHQMTKSISHAVVSLNRFANNLVATANETGEGANQMAATIEHLAEGAQDQSGAVGEMVASINQVGQLAADTDRSLAQAVGMSRDVLQAAGDGHTATQEAVNQMSRIMTASQGVTASVRSLAEVSAEIGEVVAMINDISGQINFLALNAAIEAARAGEYGRGFAVVADEVSKLADQTRESTKRIGALVADINQYMNEAAAKAELAHRETKVGVSTIEKTGQAFGEIHAAVEQLAQALTSVAENSSRVAQNADQMKNLADRVNQKVEESSAATEQVSATAQQQAAATQQLVAAAGELSSIAGQLEQLVGQFRLTDSPLIAARKRTERGSKGGWEDLIDASAGIIVE